MDAWRAAASWPRHSMSRPAAMGSAPLMSGTCGVSKHMAGADHIKARHTCISSGLVWTQNPVQALKRQNRSAAPTCGCHDLQLLTHCVHLLFFTPTPHPPAWSSSRPPHTPSGRPGQTARLHQQPSHCAGQLMPCNGPIKHRNEKVSKKHQQHLTSCRLQADC
jgi:hypothetical protein